MLKKILLLSFFGFEFFLFPNNALTEDITPEQSSDRLKVQEQEQVQKSDQIGGRDEEIYGWQLMTPEERTEHRARMSAAKTDEEREQIRREHHERMEKRAKVHGVTLPDEPSRRGKGSGYGPGGGRDW